MSRYLLIAIGVLAMSACTDDRPHGSTSQRSGSEPEHGMGDMRRTDGSPKNQPGGSSETTTEASMNGPSRTAAVAGAGRNDDATTTSRSTSRTGESVDRKESMLTAGDQSEADADRRITQQIRQAVVADPQLSIKAKNCTIVTIGGIVTLRGSVDTPAERLSVGSKVDGVFGVRRVDNNLEIMR